MAEETCHMNFSCCVLSALAATFHVSVQKNEDAIKDYVSMLVSEP